jgi:hypothetical protein
MHDIDKSFEFENFEFEAEDEGQGEQEGVFSEAEETELAAELLSVSNEEEMEQFLGDLIKKAGSAVGSFIKSPTGQAIGGYLKSAAKKLLPKAGQAIGGYLGGSTGANIGGQLGSKIGGMFEMEEEDEMEAAKSFVRLAADAVKAAAQAPPNANPRAVAAAAVKQAAEVHAPSLVSGGGSVKPSGGGKANGGGQGKKGVWIARGNNILLIGANR